MDSDLVRFRVDRELREQAARVCSDLGLELHDVLRALVARIARDRALPFALDDRPARRSEAAAPFAGYDSPRWSGLKRQLDAELAIALLVRFVADCSVRLADAEDAAAGDPETVARLERERTEALALRRALDPNDAEAVARIIAGYGPQQRTGSE